MFKAFAKAVSKGVPVIIDPVGAGATLYRTQTIRELISAGQPTIIRGNASEIMALTDDRLKTKGVDSTAASDEALHAAKQISKERQCAVCISGAVDYIVSGDRMAKIANGHQMMTRLRDWVARPRRFAGLLRPWRKMLWRLRPKRWRSWASPEKWRQKFRRVPVRCKCIFWIYSIPCRKMTSSDI
jgi:hypothetical protein